MFGAPDLKMFIVKLVQEFENVLYSTGLLIAGSEISGYHFPVSNGSLFMESGEK